MHKHAKKPKAVVAAKPTLPESPAEALRVAQAKKAEDDQRRVEACGKRILAALREFNCEAAIPPPIPHAVAGPNGGLVVEWEQPQKFAIRALDEAQAVAAPAGAMPPA